MWPIIGVKLFMPKGSDNQGALTDIKRTVTIERGTLKDSIDIKGNYPSLYDFSKLPKEEKDAIKEELFTYDFFRYMQPLFKGIELLKYYQKNYPNVVILSAIGSSSHSDEIERAKREWLEEHIGNITAHFVNKTEDKFNITKLYPSFSNHLLVDDRTKAVDPWIAKGGIGVLFT